MEQSQSISNRNFLFYIITILYEYHKAGQFAISQGQSLVLQEEKNEALTVLRIQTVEHWKEIYLKHSATFVSDDLVLLPRFQVRRGTCLTTSLPVYFLSHPAPSTHRNTGVNLHCSSATFAMKDLNPKNIFGPQLFTDRVGVAGGQSRLGVCFFLLAPTLRLG